MPSTDDFSSAGARAAHQPVPLAPPIAHLEAEVSRRRTRRRRTVGSSIAGVALLAALPVAASQLSDDPEPPSVFTAPAQGAEADELAQDSSTTVAPSESTPASTTESEPENGDVSPHERPHLPFAPMFGDGEFTLGFGDVSFSFRTVSGDEAAELATAAESAATETRTIDDQIVWIETDGDTTTVSVVIEANTESGHPAEDTFIEATGPTEHMDALLDFAVDGVVGFGDGFPFEHGPMFDELFPDGLPDMEELLPPELFEELERFRNGDLESGRGFFFDFPPCAPDAGDGAAAEGVSA